MERGRVAVFVDLEETTEVADARSFTFDDFRSKVRAQRGASAALVEVREVEHPDPVQRPWGH